MQIVYNRAGCVNYGGGLRDVARAGQRRGWAAGGGVLVVPTLSSRVARPAVARLATRATGLARRTQLTCHSRRRQPPLPNPFATRAAAAAASRSSAGQGQTALVRGPIM